ncbi:MAG: Hsp70 family protein, partial [Candidatus Competibacterales bacterium]
MVRPSRYAVGIDLGTTHCALAYADTQTPAATRGSVARAQLGDPGDVAAEARLPALRYQLAPGELSPEAGQLPWSKTPLESELPAGIVGALAGQWGARVPGRLVVSAKSWLSHARVDRTAPILPWGAPGDVPKVSPLQASASYLAHLGAAWNQAFPGHPLERQDVVVTLPASFDEDARALTLAAARLAGLPRVQLLEEPQAACYHWLRQHQDNLAAALGDRRLLLVCDIGGGTLDLTLIAIEPQGEGPPVLRRIGVGDHLMV